MRYLKCVQIICEYRFVYYATWESVYQIISSVSTVYLRSFVHSSVAMQPFLWSWPLVQFRKLSYTVGMTPWTSDQPVSRPLPTHRTTHRINAHTDIHAFEWDSDQRSQRSSERRLRGYCDRRVFTHRYLNMNACYNNI
jgi:hypothetical protein